MRASTVGAPTIVADWLVAGVFMWFGTGPSTTAGTEHNRITINERTEAAQGRSPESGAVAS